MKKRTHFAAVFLLSILLLISACARGSQERGGPTNPFRGGASSIKMKFVRDAPPPEVTDSRFPFKVVLEITNDGEATVKRSDVNIRLRGFLPEDFGYGQGVTYRDIIDLQPENDLLSKIRDPEGNVIEGTTTFLTIPASKSFQVRPLLGNDRVTVWADICYPYESYAVGKLCVTGNLLDNRKDRLCNPTGGRSIFSSSAPVQAVNLKQHVISENTLSFSFDISHRGSGTVYKLGDTFAAGDCPRDNPGIRRDAQDKVRVDIKLNIPNSRIRNCNFEAKITESSGYIRMIDNLRTVACTVDLPQQRSDFESNLDLTVRYNYDDSISTPVTIKHVVTS